MFRQPLSPQQRTRLSILLTIVGLLLWAHSIIYARLEIGYLGLIHGLPVTFFAALTVISAASALLWFAKENHSKLLCLQLLIIIIALWFAPLISGGSHPITTETYGKLALVNLVVGQGSFSAGKVWYLAWPGAQILLANLQSLTGLNFQTMVPLLISITFLIFLPPLYLLLRNFLGESRINYCWAGLWLFSIAFWVDLIFISPAGIGYFLFLTFLTLITLIILKPEQARNKQFLFLALIVFAAMVITHMLSALVALAILALLALIFRKKSLAICIIPLLLLLLAWDVTEGAHYLKIIRSEPLVETTAPLEMTTTEEETTTTYETPPQGALVLDPTIIAEREITGHFSGSESHSTVAKIRVIFSSVFALIGIAGVVWLLVFRRRYKEAILIMVIVLASLAFLPLTKYYRVELLHRLYLFALPAIAITGAMLMEARKTIPLASVCLLIIALFPLHIIAHYGNEELDYFPTSQRLSLEFFDNNTSHGYTVGNYPMGRSNQPTNYYQLRWPRIDFLDNKLVSIVPLRKGESGPFYVGISRWDRAWHGWYEGNYTFIEGLENSLETASNCNLIYASKDTLLYISNEVSYVKKQ
jgi:hypothetical protein